MVASLWFRFEQFLQRKTKLSLSARMSEQMTGLLHEEFLRQAGSLMEVSLSMTDRRSIEDFIAREHRIYAEAESIDPETIASLRTEGAEFLVVSRFHPTGAAYALEAHVLDMRTGRRVGAGVEEDFDPRFTSELSSRF